MGKELSRTKLRTLESIASSTFTLASCTTGREDNLIMAAMDDPDPDYRSLSRPPPSDPDIQATLSDFLTYTEHFPAHLVRASSLIHEQRTKAERMVKQVHDDTTAYSLLPTLKANRPDPIKLRRDISRALEEAEAASRMSLAEAIRLDEECKREARRLDVVTKKLKAQPKPPSRDPTPEQQALTSPNLKRDRGTGTRGDETRPERQLKRVHDKAVSKIRGRKVMVPGEVIPPPDPNAPFETMSNWTSPRGSPGLLEVPGPIGKFTSPRPRSRTPKPPRQQSQAAGDDKNAKPRIPRGPGHLGTNAHSAVAGISTSNALLALHEPPADAANGSKWLPWMKLTEWEMAKLRKRMKKNAIWVPSQTMVRRELKNLGRGMAGKEAARAQAEISGERFVDEPNEADPTKVVISGEETDQMNSMLGPQIYEEDDDDDAELINRGMRLNEAKKLKRLRMKEEAAIQEQLAREQGVQLPLDGSNTSTASPDHKKRKRETTPAADPSTHETDTHKQGPILKRLKIAAPSQPSVQKVPLAPAGASVATTRNSRRAATPPATKRPTITLKVGKAVSEEPPSRRASTRRNSNASLPSTSMSSTNAAASPDASTAITKSGRRSRRPVPGVITSKDDESAKVGVSRRKAAPNRKRATSAKKDSLAPNDPQIAAEALDEYIDPNEPRYCICGDVSWGTMVGCDADDCKQEWFHLECVNLSEEPKRLTKWYCPECRKKLKLGVNTNGLVGRNM